MLRKLNLNCLEFGPQCSDYGVQFNIRNSDVHKVCTNLYTCGIMNFTRTSSG